MKAHGRARRELEVSREDPHKDDTEGRPSEDRWLGGGGHGWLDRLLRRQRR
ncbi:MAG TPA: hypothetical protein VKU86_10385 [Acidimicrobiales bacterium]|nr:hypothetical protein [Acidimicrobiales bacterium]